MSPYLSDDARTPFLARISPKRLGIFVLANTLVCGVLFWLAETLFSGGMRAFDAAYWTVVTAPTVGYGDILPTCDASKIVTMWLILSSWVSFGLAISLLGAKYAAWMIANPFEKEVLDDMDDNLALNCILLEQMGKADLIPDSVEEYHAGLLPNTLPYARLNSDQVEAR